VVQYSCRSGLAVVQRPDKLATDDHRPRLLAVSHCGKMNHVGRLDRVAVGLSDTFST
jgi:hypothetical protein